MAEDISKEKLAPYFDSLKTVGGKVKGVVREVAEPIKKEKIIDNSPLVSVKLKYNEDSLKRAEKYWADRGIVADKPKTGPKQTGNPANTFVNVPTPDPMMKRRVVYAGGTPREDFSILKNMPAFCRKGVSPKETEKIRRALTQLRENPQLEQAFDLTNLPVEDLMKMGLDAAKNNKSSTPIGSLQKTFEQAGMTPEAVARQVPMSKVREIYGKMDKRGFILEGAEGALDLPKLKPGSGSSAAASAE